MYAHARTAAVMQKKKKWQGDTHMWIHRRCCGASVLLGEAERGGGGGVGGDRTMREGCREGVSDGGREGECGGTRGGRGWRVVNERVEWLS